MLLNAFKCGFEHDVCSCHKSQPKEFTWVYDKPGDIEIYFESSFLDGLKSNCNNKFLWFSESKALYFDRYDYLLQNLNQFKTYKKIFVHDYDLLYSDSIFEYCPAGSNKSWIVDGKIYEKNKLVSMICSGKNVTSGHKFRNKMAHFLKNSGFPIDFYGRNVNPFDKKETALADYCFSVVIENSKYPHYYTEKIMDCFATGTIPIYHGSPEIHKEFNMDGIILFDESFNFGSLSKDLYLSKLDAVKDNFEREKTHKIADDHIFDLVKKYV